MKKRFLTLPSPTVRCFLRVSLPLLALASVAVLVLYLEQHAANPSVAAVNYAPLAEYPLAGLAVAAGGAYMIEYIIQRHK